MIKRPNNALTSVLNRQHQTVLLGKRTSRVALTASVMIGGLIISRETVFKDAFRRLLYGSRNEETSDIPSTKVLGLVQKAMDDLGLSMSERKVLTVFSHDFTPTGHIGSLDTQFGSCLMLPTFFNMTSTSETHHLEDFVELMKKSNLGEDDEADFAETFVLSDNAKLYCIARELSKSRVCSYVLEGIIGSVASYLAIAGASALEMTFFPFAHAFAKLPVYLICAGISFVVFSAATDFLSFYMDKKAENSICSLGNSYVAGGIELCEKEIKRRFLIDKVIKNNNNQELLSVMKLSDRLSYLKGNEKNK